MSERTKTPRRDRRAFIKGVAVAGGAVAVAGGSAVADVSAEKPEAAKAKADGSKGYHETDHIREYYRLAQF
ncbi:MAG TPA: twin-arginine translocation signal domain-containing protein [Gammaproteobacteria bacterium]|nr:twin-arginine translocation signal domain-containing protein [Gammaproteobacteria bacterium]